MSLSCELPGGKVCRYMAATIVNVIIHNQALIIFDRPTRAFIQVSFFIGRSAEILA